MRTYVYRRIHVHSAEGIVPTTGIEERMTPSSTVAPHEGHDSNATMEPPEFTSTINDANDNATSVLLSSCSGFYWKLHHLFFRPSGS